MHAATEHDGFLWLFLCAVSEDGHKTYTICNNLK